MRKLSILFAFLLSYMGGVNSALAETITENFDNVSFTKDGVTTTSWDANGLSNGWVYQGSGGYLYGDGSSYPGFGLTSGYNYTGKALVSNYGSSVQATYLIIPQKLMGNITFNVKRTSSSYTGKVSFYEVTSTETDGTIAYSIGSLIGSFESSSTTWTDGSIDIGEEGAMIAINLFRIAFDNFTANTYEETGMIAKPKNFSASNITFDSADLSWTAGGEETAWQLVYSTDANFDKDAATPIDITTNPYTLTGLQENTTYYAYLRAKSGEDVSSWTSKISFTTAIQFPAPTGFALNSYTATTATFGWTAGSNETAWELAFSTSEDFDPNNEGTKMAVSTNPYTLEDLTAEITYYAYLRAVYEDGNSAWSDKVVFKPSNTMNLTINEGTTTSMYIPIYGNWVDNVDYNKSQFIIPSSSISTLANRDITKLTFYTNSTTTIPWTGNIFDVYMKETTETTVSTTFDRTGDKVFTGSLTVNADGTMEVTLDESFTYGGQNLLIGFDMTTKGQYKSTSFYGVNGGSSMYTSNGSGSASTFLPKMTITSVPADDTPTAKMEVASDDIDFGKITPETAAADKQKTFTISNSRGTADLTNINIVSDNEAFIISQPSTTIAAGAEEAMTVTVTMNTEGMEAGTKNATITVSADGQDEVTINVIAVYANAAATMDVTLNGEAVTETVDFGTVRKETAKTFTISNTGDLTLNASIASNNTTDFTVTPETLTIAGGETGEFTVTFMMSEDFNAEKNANITLSAEGLENVVIAVKGTRTDVWGEDFEEATSETLTTDGWEVSSGWTIGVVSNDPNNDTKQMHISSDYDSSYHSLVTPKLNANENDVLTFDAYYNYGDEPVKVSYSTDKSEWTIISEEDNGGNNSEGNKKSKTITVNAPLTGNFYLKFEARYGGGIDNIAGFKLAPQPTVLDQNTANTITTGVQDITLNYVFSKAAGRNYNTIAVPFGITDLSIFGEGVKAYTLQSYDEANSNVTFSEVETLEAGKPYMLHADTPTSESTFNFYNVNVTDANEGETAITGVTFHANYSYKAAGDISGEWYGVNSTTGNVQKAGTTTHLLAFRGYFTFDGSVDLARLNVTFLDNDGGATNINGAEVFNNLTGDIYDLSGRKVLNAQKGIYIQNGKKYVVK